MSISNIKVCLLSALTGVIILSAGFSPVVLAQSDGKQATQTEVNEGIENAKQVIDELSKKIYAAHLFSPQDTNKLVQLKIDLLGIWEKNPTNKSLAKPLYETAVLLMQREMFDESKEISNIIIENFPKYSSDDDDEESEEGSAGSTVDYSAKAQNLLKKIEAAEAQLQ